MFFNRVAILGVGLIGASFALAIKKQKLCGHITGHGRRKENLSAAIEMGIIDSFDLDPARASEGCDLVFFSMPVGSFADTAKKIRDSLQRGAIVTDAGSVKGGLVHEMETILSGRASFVGAHPIAGGEKTGIGAADAGLFNRRRCIITPTDRTDLSALDKIQTLWKSIGAATSTMSPGNHDRVFGAVSHLPHIIAYELMNTVDEIDRSFLGFAGQGFIDTTRIASSSPELWRDIALFNRENLIHFIDLFIRRLEGIKHHIIGANAVSLEDEFRKAKSLRDNLGQD